MVFKYVLSSQLLTIVWDCYMEECNVANILTEHINTHTNKRIMTFVWLKSHFASSVRMLRCFFFPICFPFSHLCLSSAWWFDCRIAFTIVDCEALLVMCLNFISKRMGNYLYIEFQWFFLLHAIKESLWVFKVNSIAAIIHLSQFKMISDFIVDSGSGTDDLSLQLQTKCL